ncbi:hypothetical protein KIMC2_02340 [Xylocopilactobacillus apis]|uniref:Bacteriocin n=1 Tax=Xylocopilactobacillus apis TaxID=2932183 RepID=A0AAU9CNY5_9LACO|nr:hypothetical protein KIMC2_02340 [Xylocopilactobacillus apis]
MLKNLTKKESEKIMGGKAHKVAGRLCYYECKKGFNTQHKVVNGQLWHMCVGRV